MRSGALIRNPKNLFNETEFAKLSDVSIDTYEGENCYRFTPTMSAHRIPFFAKAGETVTFSFEIAYPNGLDMYIFAESATHTITIYDWNSPKYLFLTYRNSFNRLQKMFTTKL